MYPLGELVQKGAADQTRADDTDGNRLWRKIDGRMHRAQRFRRIVLLNDCRDVSLRRPLRDRAHVDAGFAERVEKFAGDTGPFDHPIANHGQDAAVVDDLYSLYGAAADLR